MVFSAVNDIGMLPISCPQCKELINLYDIDLLLEKEDELKWEKIIKNSFNKFLLDSKDVYVPCLTVNCNHYFEKK